MMHIINKNSKTKFHIKATAKNPKGYSSVFESKKNNILFFSTT